MAHDVHIERLAGAPLAVLQRQARRSDLARLVPQCCGLVWNVLRAQQATGGRYVAVYWDASIRLEVGAEVAGPFVEQDGVVRSTTPEGLVASTTHFGPYGGLGAAHAAVQRWCEANHYHLVGPNWEIYGHWQPEWNGDPSLIRTDVCYLVNER